MTLMLEVLTSAVTILGQIFLVIGIAVFAAIWYLVNNLYLQ